MKVFYDKNWLSLIIFNVIILKREKTTDFRKVEEVKKEIFIKIKLYLIDLYCNSLYSIMTDIHDKITRSYNMGRIKGKDTKPELIVRKFLFSKGFRFRLHDKNLSGEPDIVLRKYKTLIFVNGCFWHGHDQCKYAVIPKTRTEWWRSKIERTKKRDLENSIELEEQGWKVVVLWECELKPKIRRETLENFILKLTEY